MKIAVLTGAGISAESGVPTFRDAGGLWEGHDIAEVASPEGWKKNPALVLDFYNQRRRAIRNVQPNAAHFALAELEKHFPTVVITQNIDDLHERAGSKNIIHLHGEILKAQSSLDPNLVYNIEDKDIALGDLCEFGSQLRPYVVWFGEAVPMIERAVYEVADADIFMVIGTSLAVYPAASLISYVPENAAKYIIDPNIPQGLGTRKLVKIAEKAAEAVPQLVQELIAGK